MVNEDANRVSEDSQETERIERIWQRLESIPDPELPFLNVVELGMVPRVFMESGEPIVEVMPTYTGCPATDVILQDVRNLLAKIEPLGQVRLVLTPPWTTDVLTEATKEKMRAHGIAPPEGGQADRAFLLGKNRQVACPRCRSWETSLVSAFGSTACKAHYRCNACQEPFDHFKCI